MVGHIGSVQIEGNTFVKKEMNYSNSHMPLKPQFSKRTLHHSIKDLFVKRLVVAENKTDVNFSMLALFRQGCFRTPKTRSVCIKGNNRKFTPLTQGRV